MPPLNGYIALHRSLLDWEWYSDINARVVFIHCLLIANFKEKKWRGNTILRGQFISSRKEMASQIGITEQQFRTAMNKLISTNDITSSGSAQHTVFTVVNYEKYQGVNQQDNQPATNDQPADNQPATNDQPLLNNVNNVNKEINIAKPKKTSATKTQIPSDICLSEEWKALALNYWATKNRNDLSADEEFFKFKNHHLAEGTKFLDWKAAWSKWYANSVKYNKPSFQLISGQQGQQTPPRRREMPKAGTIR